MAVIRFTALEHALHRHPCNYETPKTPISDYFGINVFDKQKMKKYVSGKTYAHVIEAIEMDSRIDDKIADQVASAMKTWAIEMGATHYAHWFQPIIGVTAETYNAFVDFNEYGSIIESFSGKLLTQHETDASSFQSGSTRNSSEACCYTAWDPCSPAFIIGNTLNIPSIYISCTGESLDARKPLLKALYAVNKASVDVCQYFDKDVTKITATLGWEQEYFLIDDALYNARPDLAHTGRTLIGHASAKDQQLLEEQYFDSIPEQVTSFINEFETESYKLGIPIKTRHNAMAPNQFACATVFEECNLAVDHNLLLMELMSRIARQYNFAVLYHEKPFNYINGSGKRCNWSIATNTGVNLLSPGKNAKTNLQFLVFLVNTLKAVHKHADLLRAGIVSPGNAYRIGTDEAPPTIFSAMIGKQITELLDRIEEKVADNKLSADERTKLALSVIKDSKILLDNTDRNRTSLVAFTGDKFELRAIGSSANIAVPMIVLNSAVAEQLVEFKKEVDRLVNKNIKKYEALFQVLRQYIIDSKSVLFEGNNYSDEWKKKAASWGLSNIGSSVEALDAYLTPKSRNLLGSLNIMSERENEAHAYVRWNNYTNCVQIETRVMEDLILHHIIPVVIRFQTELIESINGLKGLLGEKEYKEQAGERIELIRTISHHVSYIKAKVAEMIEARNVACKIEDERLKAMEYSTKIFCYLDDIRNHVDNLELIVDDEYWPLPKYRELLFIR